jgi:hypothetical protein
MAYFAIFEWLCIGLSQIEPSTEKNNCFHPPENHTRNVLQQVEPWATDGSRSNLVPAASNVCCDALFECCNDLNTLCDAIDMSLS